MKTTDSFKLKWIGNDGTTGEVNIIRSDFLNLMNQIKTNFVDNNTYATKFVEIIPNTKLMEINFHRNNDMEVPLVLVETIDGQRELISIPRVNRIIWNILIEFSK